MAIKKPKRYIRIQKKRYIRIHKERYIRISNSDFHGERGGIDRGASRKGGRLFSVHHFILTYVYYLLEN